MIGLYLFLPSSSSKSGQAVQREFSVGMLNYLLYDFRLIQLTTSDQRRALERLEGDRERDETDAEKTEEKEIIRNAAREKKKKGTKPG